MKRTISLGVLAALTYLVVYSVPMQPKEKFVGVIEKVMPAVVEIHVEGLMVDPFDAYMKDILGIKEPPRLVKVNVLGSGVFISKHGRIITAAHLFRDFKKVTSITIVSPNGDNVAGFLVKIASKADLAVVKTEYYKETPCVRLADPRGLRIGQEVFAIGSPIGLSFSVSSGIISSLYRDFQFGYNVTQSDTVINPGNSGGPLFNLKGELVGINVFGISDRNGIPYPGLGFSEQCGEIYKFLIDVKKVDKEVF